MHSGSSAGVGNDHSYAKPSVASSFQMKKRGKGHNCLTPTKGSHDDVYKSLLRHKATISLIGNTVQASEEHEFVQGDHVLLLLNGRSVACGQVLGGSHMHGRDVPVGFTVVSLNEVLDSKCPLQLHSRFDDDDDVLTAGMITGWPTRLLKNL